MVAQQHGTAEAVGSGQTLYVFDFNDGLDVVCAERRGAGNKYLKGLA